MKKILIVLSLFSFVQGCAPSVEEEVDQTVQKHIQAKSSTEAREADPEKVFVNAEQKKSTELCEALARKTDAQLLIFEVQIQNPRYQNLIAKCKDKLVQRVESAKKERVEGSAVSATTLNFKIPFEIQYRDLSAGYTAITGDTQNKQVILSFDDGPHPTLSKQIAAMLEKVGVRAHFLQVGVNVKKYPSITQFISAQGHSIGNHSWDHSDFTQLSFEAQLKQISDTNKIILQTIGWVDPFFRFPYGATTVKLNQFLKTHEGSSFLWSVDSNDWKKVNENGTVRTNAQVIKETLEQLDKKGRGLVLFHDVHTRTAELMPAFLTALYKRGYKVVMLQASDSRLKNNPLLP